MRHPKFSFGRITLDPAVLGGRACFRGLRIPVHLVLDLLASGQTADNIIKDYPDLTQKDIQEALKYGAWLAHEESLPIRR